MSYLALARKWRPRTFSQLVGQDHVTKALINSLNQQRLHHAYLFTGTRGVGKTSVARLLAKSLNCEVGICAIPCLQCDACIAIEQSRFIDLIEIDGASKTRVEDTRELLENVQYLPTNGRFKIYLIDEVHMLSQHSFNALLKTLEEPPSHVKFILATTDPQKLPVTVLSRCLQFNLKHVPAEIICQHLEHILQEEQRTYDVPAIALLAKAAKGSVRDALSLLDQTIAYCPDHIATSDVKSSLGYTQQDYALQLLQALATFDSHALIRISQNIARESGHFRYVLDEMLCYLHQLSVSQHVSNAQQLLELEPSVTALREQFTPEDLLLLYHIGLKGADDMALAPSMTIGFEMTLLRMHTFRPAVNPTPPAYAYQTATLPQQPITRLNAYEEAPKEKDIALCAQDDVHLQKEQTNWPNIVSQLNLSGLALSAVDNTHFLKKTGATVTLQIAKKHHSIFTPTVIKRINDALTNYFKETITVVLECDAAVLSTPAQQKIETLHQQHQDAETSLQNDPFFQQLQQEFSAKLVENSIAQRKDDL